MLLYYVVLATYFPLAQLGVQSTCFFKEYLLVFLRLGSVRNNLKERLDELVGDGMRIAAVNEHIKEIENANKVMRLQNNRRKV